MKPSIFSKDYDRHMRKRKRKLIILIISIIVLIFCSYIYFNSGSNGIVKIFNKVTAKSQQLKSKEQKSNNINKNSNLNKENKNKQSIKESNKQKSYSFNISVNNKDIKILYNESNGKRVLKQAKTLDDKDIYYDINISKDAMIIYDKETQEIFYVDDYGKTSNISKQEYVSSSGDVFKKDDVLKNNKNYIWCSNPKFLSDDKVVFLSQLPWFNGEHKKYIWYGNIKDKDYIFLKNDTSDNVKFGKLTDEGLQVIIDDNTYILMNNGYLK